MACQALVGTSPRPSEEQSDTRVRPLLRPWLEAKHTIGHEHTGCTHGMLDARGVAGA